MDLEDKKVLVRVDYNVPIKNGMVEDDSRLRSTVPTINFLLEKNCKIILMSHLDRPQKLLKKGKKFEEIKKEFTLRPVAEDLSEILGVDVVFVEGSVDIEIPEEDVVLLENIQFNPGEVTNDEDFARKLASVADVYVNDGFGQSHREYASYCAITKFLPSCVGFLVEKELKQLGIDECVFHGRLLFPLRAAYKINKRVGSGLSRMLESFDVMLSNLRWTIPLAGHLIVIAKRPISSSSDSLSPTIKKDDSDPVFVEAQSTNNQIEKEQIS